MQLAMLTGISEYFAALRAEDMESSSCHLGAIIVRDLSAKVLIAFLLRFASWLLRALAECSLHRPVHFIFPCKGIAAGSCIAGHSRRASLHDVCMPCAACLRAGRCSREADRPASHGSKAMPPAAGVQLPLQPDAGRVPQGAGRDGHRGRRHARHHAAAAHQRLPERRHHHRREPDGRGAHREDAGAMLLAHRLQAASARRSASHDLQPDVHVRAVRCNAEFRPCFCENLDRLPAKV